jgi:hypothetical protein
MIRAATFASKTLGDVYPTTSLNPVRSGPSVPGLTFQVRPTLADCDRRLAQTPHAEGMIAAYLDGSVQLLAPNMSESAFWGAVTPTSGDSAD